MVKTKNIAVLRGINVGGKNRIKMQDLVSCLEGAGLEDVRTYIQSGNISFNSNSPRRELELMISEQLKLRFEYDVLAIVRTKRAWNQLIAQNPFCESGVPTCDIKQLHVTLLAKKPTKAAIEQLSAIPRAGDQFHAIGDRIYLRIVNGYSKTKLTNGHIEKRLGIAATSRNWKTICKLADL